MQYDHLSFYSHGASAAAGSQATSFMIGGSGVLPVLNGSRSGAGDDREVQNRVKSAVEKHIEIVEYLKRLPESSWVSVVY